MVDLENQVVLGAVIALTGVVFSGLVGLLVMFLNNYFQTARERRSWLLNRQRETYEWAVIAAAKRRYAPVDMRPAGRDNVGRTDSPDMSKSASADLMAAVNVFRLYFSEHIDRAGRGFYPLMRELEEKAAGKNAAELGDVTLRVFNYMEEIVAKAFGIRLYEGTPAAKKIGMK